MQLTCANCSGCAPPSPEAGEGEAGAPPAAAYCTRQTVSFGSSPHGSSRVTRANCSGCAPPSPEAGEGEAGAPPAAAYCIATNRFTGSSPDGSSRLIHLLALQLITLVIVLFAPDAQAQQSPTKAAEGVESIDRVVVRWSSRATGGVKKPRFITARELAFEARIEAFGELVRQPKAFNDKHVRAAIQRHITETMLANLPVDPKPTPKQVGSYAEAARAILAQRIGAGDPTLGAKKLDQARRAESMTNKELDRLMRRRARASWYLDKMVAPMLQPSELDLREVHKRGESPFTAQKYEDIERQLRQWYVSTRLAAALERYFRNARSRILVKMIERPVAATKK